MIQMTIDFRTIRIKLFGLDYRFVSKTLAKLRVPVRRYQDLSLLSWNKGCKYSHINQAY